MELLMIMLLIALIIIVVNNNSKFSKNFIKLDEEVRLLRRQLSDSKEVKPLEQKPVAEQREQDLPKPYNSLFTVADPITVAGDQEKEAIINNEPPPQFEDTVTTTTEDVTTVYRPTPTAAQQSKPSFFERNPDLEKFIGENLVSKIGIAVLVLAIGFFVKYAIDQNWIGPVGRVSVGILCGGLLVGIAHKLRDAYKSFSSVLAGGGLAVFYFTITLAFHQFQLFGQVTAFIIMSVITIFAVLLSLLYDKQELAVIALVGGFVAPFLVSTGSGNYISLFTYLIILNAGLLAIAYRKSWRILNILSFIFTVLLYASWLYSIEVVSESTYRNAFLFAAIFYAMFFLINIAHNIKEKKKFIAADFSILLANAALFFATGLYCLTEMKLPELRGLFSASLGVINLVAAYFLFRKQKIDNNILYLLIGLTLTFISVTAPIQLEGNHITIFWASEAVLLYWLFTKSSIPILQYATVIVWGLMLASLLIDWYQVYERSYPADLRIILNKGFVTGIFSAIATYSLFLLYRKEMTLGNQVSKPYLPSKSFYRWAALAILFIAGALELNHQFGMAFPGTSTSVVYLLLYLLCFVHVFLWVNERKASGRLSFSSAFIAYAAIILIYLIALPKQHAVQANLIESGIPNGIFFGHWISALLMLVLLYRFTTFLRKNTVEILETMPVLTWLLCTVTVVFFSSELLLLANAIFVSKTNSLADVQHVYVRTGLPIIWSICSFAFMWLGMHFKHKSLRIVSLTLFMITLIKLFIFDIRNIPAGGKIAAFFCLGILLLVVSFMYQRLKKIIIDHEEKRD